jgi:hypothetical protein
VLPLRSPLGGASRSTRGREWGTSSLCGHFPPNRPYAQHRGCVGCLIEPLNVSEGQASWGGAGGRGVGRGRDGLVMQDKGYPNQCFPSLRCP